MPANRRLLPRHRPCWQARQCLDVWLNRNQTMLALFRTIDFALDIYTWIIIASAVFSWLYAFNIVNARNPFVASIGDFPDKE